jgi:predicted permease
VDGVSREIVGIMPARFRFPKAGTQVWIPLQLDPVDPPPTAYAYAGIARLKPGVTVAVAERDFASVLPRLPQLYPNFVSGISTKAMMDQMHPRPVLAPLQDDLTAGIAGTLWMIAAAAVLVLLVACANVANLALVRADARQRELAVREAIGAGRGRLLLHFFVESALIAVAGATCGLAAAATAVRALVSAGPTGIPRLSEVRMDGTSVLFTVLVTAIVAIGCSLLPATRVGRGRGVVALRDGGRGTAGRAQQQVRGALVAAQVAFALVVLAGSGLLMRTFARLHSIRLGFDAASVSTFWTSLPAIRYKSDTAVVQSYARLVDRLSALPGVTTVGLASRLPLEVHGIDENPIYPEDDASFATKLPPLQLFTAVNGDYFRAIGIPLIAGKTFEPMGAQRDGEAIISRSTALSFWKDSTGIAALGKRFRPLPTGRVYTVVGVVGDTRDTALAAPPSQVVYFPETFETGGRTARSRRTMALVVRTLGGNGSLLPAVQQAVRELDPTLPTFDVRTMGAVESAATAQLTFIITVLGGAAVVTLILGALGLYSVLAYIVTLRTRELAIRLSLGATPMAVAGSMTRYGVTLAGVGIGAGLVLFALIARSLRTMLFGVSAGDPIALGAAALTLVAVALLASWLPARRAARIDPAITLRSS